MLKNNSMQLKSTMITSSLTNSFGIAKLIVYSITKYIHKEKEMGYAKPNDRVGETMGLAIPTSRNLTPVLRNGPIKFIPQKKSTENNLRSEGKLHLKLNEVNASWARLFSIIAHDLKSPFNVLLNYTDILIDDFDTMKRKDIKKYLLTLHKSAQKNYRLTQNLLSWAMLQRGAVKINKQEISIKKLIDESICICTDMAEQKEIKVVNRCTTTLTGKIDKDVAISILSNLINNALKFTPQNGIITINSKKLNSNILIKVEDNGIGMSKDVSKSLHNLNSVISTKGTANEKGTGLGLVLCKELIQLHNGMIKIRSTLGKGTTVLALF